MEVGRICEDCSAIFRNRLKKKAILGVLLGDQADFALRKSLQELKESKSQSCEFCEQLCSLLENFIEEAESWGRKRPNLIAKTLYKKDAFSIRFSIVNSWEIDQSRLEIMDREYSSAPSLLYSLPSMPIYAMSGDPAAEEIGGKPPMSDLNSQKSIETIKSWFRCCDEGHNRCGNMSKNQLPTRVIDVSHLPNPRLYSSEQGETGHYACLSYCWGGEQTFKTTTKSLCDRLHSICLTELPQTLQDAISVTISLGLRFLWIDSLCIVQDDADDKAREISRMGMIYSQSYITISAASASTCWEGFLEPRPVAPLMNVPFKCKDGRMGSVLIGYSEKITSGNDSIQEKSYNDNIHTRGWTFQETLLPSRILIYGKMQLYWKCREKNTQLGRRACDEYFSINAIPELDKLLEKARISTESKSIRWRKVKSSELSMPNFLWIYLVQDYSSRKFTNSEDRVSAFSGVVSMIRELFEDTYLAGVWMSNIVHHLLWYRGYDTNEQDYGHRPKMLHLAPSWSWLSQYGRVQFEEIGLTPEIRLHKHSFNDSISPNDCHSPEVLEVEGTIFEVMSFERASTTVVHIPCYDRELWDAVKQAPIKTVPEDIANDQRAFIVMDEEVFPNEYLDGDGEVRWARHRPYDMLKISDFNSRPPTLWKCLLVAKYYHAKKNPLFPSTHYGLVISPITDSNNDTYRRIGYVGISDYQNTYILREKRTIRLV